MYKTWMEWLFLVEENQDGQLKAVTDIHHVSVCFLSQIKNMVEKDLTPKHFTYHLKCMEAFERCLKLQRN